MRLAVTLCCLGLVACAAPGPASVEATPVEAPPSSEAWLLRSLTPDTTRTLFFRETPRYGALFDSLSALRPDSSRLGAFSGFEPPSGLPPGYRSFRAAPLPAVPFEFRPLQSRPFQAPSRCDRATPMPQTITPDSLKPVPMPRVESGGPPPVPIPNWCDQ
ncbi:MAG: hypothetical protein AAGI52_08085 [Bacteroidota bacterium]